MPTAKKERQKAAIKIRKVLGLKGFSMARKIAKVNETYDYGLRTDLIPQLDELLGKHTYYPGCECCGDYSYVWNTPKGFLTLKYSTFEVEKK